MAVRRHDQRLAKVHADQHGPARQRRFLEKLGWAIRSRHPDDRRKVIVSLTANAWQVGQDELQPYLAAIDTTARQLSEHDRAVVARFLEHLTDNVANATRPPAEASSG